MYICSCHQICLSRTHYLLSLFNQNVLKDVFTLKRWEIISDKKEFSQNRQLELVQLQFYITIYPYCFSYFFR